MNKPLHVAPNPCNTCPYARSTPAGIWHEEEYAKLPDYDNETNPTIATFHCHQENATNIPTVCRGWLGTHKDSLAVRFAQAVGTLRPEDVPVYDDSTLYSSGEEAAQAGTRDPDEVDEAARKAMTRLLRKGAAK